MARQVTPRAAARISAAATLQAVVVRQPDVKQDVHVILRGIDVRHHGVDHRIGIRRQMGLVAADGL